ncbi:MAG: hypothetical protein Q9219_001333 [cf. Caloplaca sp. 3 TL-2023]
MSSPSQIQLIIRFALSVPDLPLTISSPSKTTPLHLLHQNIRPHLPPQYRSCPIRLISSGALLPPSTPLSTSLRLPSNPPSSLKGKAPEPPPPPATYIHCSVSTAQTLSPSALATEAQQGRSPNEEDAEPPSPSPSSPSTGQTTSHGNHTPQQQQQQQQPQGFDRLLTASFTPAEIASLRSQFTARIAHAHTPDTMPSPTSLRRLEERWLDSSHSPASNPSGSGIGRAGDEDEEEDTERGALEDMLWGNLTGFFWPVGAAVWLCREEGVWSRRRQVAVVTGVLVNLAFGVMRVQWG